MSLSGRVGEWGVEGMGMHITRPAPRIPPPNPVSDMGMDAPNWGLGWLEAIGDCNIDGGRTCTAQSASSLTGGM